MPTDQSVISVRVVLLHVFVVFLSSRDVLGRYILLRPRMNCTHVFLRASKVVYLGMFFKESYRIRVRSYIYIYICMYDMLYIILYIEIHIHTHTFVL